jgi:pilus assembly protein Flp/PilA
MSKLISRFFRNESGATAIEYGLIAAGVAVAIIAAVNSVGGALTTTLSATSGAINP